MRDILFVVHPYTYKQDSDGFVGISKTDKSSIRDRDIGLLVNQFLDREHKVVALFERSEFFESAGFTFDDNYKFIFDDRLIREAIPPTGYPRPDNRPEGINDEQWEQVKAFYASKEKFGDLLSNYRDVYFIGGILERCVANFANYCRNHRTSSNELFYIPELCVSTDENMRLEVENKLKKMNILPLNYGDTLERLVR